MECELELVEIVLVVTELELVDCEDDELEDVVCEDVDTEDVLTEIEDVVTEDVEAEDVDTDIEVVETELEEVETDVVVLSSPYPDSQPQTVTKPPVADVVTCSFLLTSLEHLGDG